jgi:hypothetical protein
LLGILNLLKDVPDELITLTAADYAELVLAKSTIQEHLEHWRARGNVGDMAQVRRFDAVTVIRRVMASCPDEYPPSATTELLFINDPALRENILRDLAATERALNNAEWKAATVLAVRPCQTPTYLRVHRPEGATVNQSSARGSRPETPFGPAFRLKISIDKLRMRCRQVDLRLGEPEPVIRVSLALGKLVTGELPGHDRIATNDALNAFIIRDGLHLEGVELAEIGNLLEPQCCVFHQPDCGCLRHKGLGRHDKLSCALAASGRSLLPSKTAIPLLSCAAIGQAATLPSPAMNSRRFHSITWSAIACSFGGMVSPNALAVLRLIASSNLVGLLPNVSATVRAVCITLLPPRKWLGG